jgi:putative protease
VNFILKSMPQEETQTSEEGKLIGKVTHYFDKIGVAVIALDDTLKVGDTIRIIGGLDTDFEQEVESMQIEHQPIQEAKKGDEIGLKVKEKVREGYKVYKL